MESERSRSPKESVRGVMLHKTLPNTQNMDETWVELELTPDKNSIEADQILYLVERIKENSANF